MGKQLEHLITIIAVIVLSIVSTLIAIAINPNVNTAEVDIGGFIICFIWLGFLLAAIESTVLLFSSMLGSKKATAVGFGVVMGLWFISAYGNNFGAIADIKYFSFFTYIDSRAVLIDGVMTGVLGDILILLAYSAILSTIAVVYFTKRDIPV